MEIAGIVGILVIVGIAVVVVVVLLLILLLFARSCEPPPSFGPDVL